MLFMLAFGIALPAMGVLAASLPTGGPPGVARSLVLIEQTLDRREVAKAELGARDRLLEPLLGGTQWVARRLSPGGATDRLARSLDRIGNPPSWPVERILAAKGGLLFVGAILGLVYGGGLTLMAFFLAAVLAAALFHLPDLLLYNAGIRRKDSLQRGLADALDMLTVCVEAGQGFDAALLHVARSVQGPIAGEFARVISEIQIGTSRADAFAAMAERTSAPELKNFVSALVQADRLGIPIGGVLREQAKTMRLVRRQRAEEKAQQVPVKILFPLMLCILPVLFIVVIGPGAIQMMKAFSGT